MTLKELIEKRAKVIQDAEAFWKKIEGEKRSLTADEQKQFDGWMDEADALKAQIDELSASEKRLSRLQSASAELRASGGRLGGPVTPGTQANAPAATEEEKAKEKRRRENKEARLARREHKEKRDKAISSVQFISSTRNFPKHKEGRYAAYRFGMWAIAAASAVFGGGVRARRYCKENGLLHIGESLSQAEQDELRSNIGHQENINYAGGYLVPDEFNNNLIVLREKFGVFRNYAKIIPMKSDTTARPRRTGGLTATFVGEGSAGSASTKAWDLVSMRAKKLMALALYTTELNEDSVINIGDDLAGEIAYAFAKKEDDCGFNGDGTNTYGGIIGLTSAFSRQGTAANQAGTVTGSGSAWTGLVLSDFNAVIARLPQYADSPNCAWFCHRTFYFQIMQKLQTAAGGTQPNQLANTTQTDMKGRYLFLGYPVIFAQILPKVSASSQYPVFFGDLSMGVDFGDRRQNTIAFSNSATIGSTNAFAQDALAIRGTERFDINCHDVGDSNATAANRNPGPICTLITG